MIEYSLEHLFSARARVQKPQMIGPIPEGVRAIFPVTEGVITGPKVCGRVLPAAGADWMTVRPDGVQAIDVRVTVETDDGALIYGAYSGFGDLGEEGHWNYLQGKIPSVIQLRAASRYVSAHPKYSWLNRLQCINVGYADVDKLILHYDIYALR